MEKKIKIYSFLFILVLVVIIIGNYIHLYFTNRDIDLRDKNTYLKLGKNNLAILIEVENKRLSLIDLASNEILKEYGVATGKAGTPTPLGTFQIAEKARWGGGFGSRWMGLNVPWGKYGIHGTNQPGSIGFNASGGCIRMRNQDVEELYSLIEVGTTVNIISGQYGPFGHGFDILLPGDIGADILEIQKRLKLMGYYEGALDGIYGDGMKRALIEFLKANNMNIDDMINYDIYEKLGIILMD
jgi:hypothetical protein